MKPRSCEIRSGGKRKKSNNSIHRDSDISMRRSRKRKTENSSCKSSVIAAAKRKLCPSTSYLEIKQSTSSNLKPNNSSKVSGVSVNTVKRIKRKVGYGAGTGVAVKNSVGMKNCRQCSECGKVALSMRTLKKYHLTGKPLCLVCWKTESKLRFRSPMNKECFVRLTDVMKIESFRKFIICNKETFEQTAKRKHVGDTELCPPRKFIRKNTESAEHIKRPRKELRCAIQECKQTFSYSQKYPTSSKNSMKQDVGLLGAHVSLQCTPEVISSKRKSLDSRKTCASAVKHERKHIPEVLSSRSKTRQKQRRRSVSSKLSATDLKPKPIVPNTCSVCLTKFSHLMDSKVHELKHCNRFPMLVLEHCRMPSSQASAESNMDKRNTNGNLRQINERDGGAHETSTTSEYTRNNHDKAVQVSFADDSETQDTSSKGVNTIITQDKAVQVNFSDERDKYRGEQNIIANKLGQEPASAGISTETKFEEAIQINFTVENVSHMLQTDELRGDNGGPVLENECEGSVERGINEKEEKDMDEVARDVNGSIPLVSLFNVKSVKANQNNDEAAVGEAHGGDFNRSVHEKGEGIHSSEMHTDEILEAVGSELHANVQAYCAEEEYKMNYVIEADIVDGKEAVGSEYHEDHQAHVARGDDEGGSYTDRAEINGGKELIEHEYNENVQTDVAEDQESHVTNMADINGDKEAVEREYHEDVPADVPEENQGESCKRPFRNEGNEASENEHHKCVERDAAEVDDQSGAYIIHGIDGKEAAGSEYHEDDQGRHYTDKSEVNEDKDFVEHEYDENMQKDVTEVQERHFKNGTDRNGDMKAVEGEYLEDALNDFVDDQEGNYKSRVCINEGNEIIENEHHDSVETESAVKDCGKRDFIIEGVESEDEDVPEDATEDQEGECTSDAERNNVQEAVERECNEDVQIEMAEIIIHRGNYTTEADVNSIQEPVETQFYEGIQDVSEDRNENEEVVEIEFPENMQVEGEEFDGRNYRIEFYTDEEHGFANRNESVDSILPETIQQCVSFEREDQREIQTHESDTNVDQESVGGDGTVNTKFHIAVREKC
jgi:hypothetical protein